MNTVLTGYRNLISWMRFPPLIQQSHSITRNSSSLILSMTAVTRQTNRGQASFLTDRWLLRNSVWTQTSFSFCATSFSNVSFSWMTIDDVATKFALPDLRPALDLARWTVRKLSTELLVDDNTRPKIVNCLLPLLKFGIVFDSRPEAIILQILHFKFLLTFWGMATMWINW